MLTVRSTPRRWWPGLVTALLALVAVVAGPSQPAHAHAELLRSEPTAGAVLDAGPATITLSFSEPVDIALGAIRLFDGAGEAILLDPSTHPDGDDAVVTVALPVLQPGSYVVSWQVLSADSHPASGAFTFQVGSASTLSPDVLEQVAESRSTNATAGTIVGVSRFAVLTAIALVGGILAAFAFGVAPPSRVRRLTVLAASLVGGIAGLLSIPVEAAYIGGLGLGTITDAEAWRTMLDTRVGLAWLLRALIIYFGGTALAVTAAQHAKGWWRSALIATLLGLGATSAYGGHGATGRWVLIGIDATVIHIVAMSVWIGGLVALLLGLGDISAEAIRRYSRVALVAAIAVVLTGVVQGIRQVERAGALFDTDYGRLLLAKSFAVAVILGFAAASRTAVHGALRRRAEPAPATVGAAGDYDRATLRRSVGAEVLFSAAVLVLTASLTGANPKQTPAAEPFSTTVVSEDYLASITVDPAGAGPNQVHIYLSSPGGSLSRPDSVSVSISDAAADIAPIGLTVVPVGANHYQALDATIPYSGTWTLTVRAVYDTFDEIVFTTEVEVR